MIASFGSTLPAAADILPSVNTTGNQPGGEPDCGDYEFPMLLDALLPGEPVEQVTARPKPQHSKEEKPEQEEEKNLTGLLQENAAPQQGVVIAIADIPMPSPPAFFNSASDTFFESSSSAVQSGASGASETSRSELPIEPSQPSGADAGATEGLVEARSPSESAEADSRETAEVDLHRNAGGADLASVAVAPARSNVSLLAVREAGSDTVKYAQPPMPATSDKAGTKPQRTVLPENWAFALKLARPVQRPPVGRTATSSAGTSQNSDRRAPEAQAQVLPDGNSDIPKLTRVQPGTVLHTDELIQLEAAGGQPEIAAEPKSSPKIGSEIKAPSTGLEIKPLPAQSPIATDRDSRGFEPEDTKQEASAIRRSAVATSPEKAANQPSSEATTHGSAAPPPAESVRPAPAASGRGVHVPAAANSVRRALEVAPITEAPKSGPVRELRMRVDGPQNSQRTAESVDLKIVERAGQIHVSVRTPDAGMAESLREQLGTLVTRLEQQGYSTEPWAPMQAAAERANVQSGMNGEAHPDWTPGGNAGQHGSSGQGSGNGNREREPRPEWLETLETNLNESEIRSFLDGNRSDW